MRKTTIATLFVLVALTAGLWLGCSTAPTGSLNQNKPPETFIVNVPPGIDTINAVSLVYWYGTDEDGVVAYYEWFISGDSVNPSLITGWDSIFASSDTMKLTVDDVPDSLIVLDTVIDTNIVSPDTFYKTRVIWRFRGYFYVRAVDDEGLRDFTPAQRGWNVFSEKPFIEICSPDNSSGMVRYYELGGRPSFWSGDTTPFIFNPTKTTQLWDGFHIWWSRKDTLNPEWNMPVGYRYKIDNGNWSSWTDLNPATEHDSFITVDQDLTDGLHVFYLQGRNKSHVESDVDSLYFRTINPQIESKKVAVIMANNLSSGYVGWFQDFFTTARPDLEFRFITKALPRALPLDSLKDIGLIIYVKEDMTQTNYISEDSLVLDEFISVGGKVWTIGPYMASSMSVLGIGERIIKTYFGLEYYDNCGTNYAFNGAFATQNALNLSYPSDTLFIEPSHTVPANYVAGRYIETYRTSNSNIMPLYLFIGQTPWNENPVAVLHNNSQIGVQTASFGFPFRGMYWDSLTYEPIMSVARATFIWFGY